MEKNGIFKKIKRAWNAWFKLAMLIASSLILIGAISTYYDDFLSLIWDNLIFKFLVSIVLLLFSLVYANKARKSFSKISIPVERDLVERSFKCLILPLSKFAGHTEDVIDICEKLFKDEENGIRFNKIENIIKDKSKGRENFKNWQPPLVSILRNLKKENEKGGIEQLWLIGSSDSVKVNNANTLNKNSHKESEKPEGSASELKFFIQILFFFFQKKFDIYVFDIKERKGVKIDENNINIFSDERFINKIAIDFNDFGRVNETFKQIIAAIKETKNKENKKIKEHEIAIDITGGQKPISIAGAVATLEYKTKIIYVDTNNIPSIKEIDATIESEPEL